MRKERVMAGLTQAAVARRTGIDRAKLSLAEGGHLRLSDHEKAVIGRVLRDALRRRHADITKLLDEQANQGIETLGRNGKPRLRSESHSAAGVAQ